MRIKALLLLGVIFAPMAGLAGWFDPDNYEDCVLEKMKGQERFLINTARKACRNEFPAEVELGWPEIADIDTAWTTSGSSIVFEITKNDSKYTVTRIRALFSTKPCREEKAKDEVTTVETFVFPEEEGMFGFGGNPKASASVDNASQYNCYSGRTLWGRLRLRK